MNRLILILTAVILLNSCSSDKSKDIVAHMSGIEKLNPISLKVNGGMFYSIKIELINNTDTVFNFWTMTCSWESNWVIGINSIKFFVECPKNYPIIKQIKPNHRIVYNGIIELVDTTDVSRNNDIKIGFVLVKANEVIEESEFYEILINKISTRKDIIWSEPFKINE